MRPIRIFVSSPSDVRDERQLVQAILKRIQNRLKDSVRLDVLLWEQSFYEATRPVQDALPRAADFDIVVLILWSTLGSAPATDPDTGTVYPSGTRFEIADAVRGRGGRRPSLLVCRCTRPFTIDASLSAEEMGGSKRRYDEVRAFFDREAAALGITSVNEFGSATAFGEILEPTLERMIRERVGEVRSGEEGGGEIEPYKGLRVMSAEDRAFFFGRSRATYQVVEALQRQERAGRPFVLVFGRSGIGKSSFVRAGVVPHIVEGGAIHGVDAWRVALFEPSDSTSDLLGGLAAALCDTEALPGLASEPGGVEGLAEQLRTAPERAVARVASGLGAIGVAGAFGVVGGRGGEVGRPGSARLLLMVDPFEEVFTRHSTDEEVRRFGRALRALCESRMVWVVGTVRIDFYARCTEYEDIRVLEEGDGHFNLPPMSASELRAVVVGPAEEAGLEFERAADGTSLADELVNAAMEHTDPLPLLAFALQQLHDRRLESAGRSVLTFEAYHSLGGLRGLLTKRADEARNAAFDRMAGDGESAWNDLFARLVTVGREGQRARLYARPASIESGDARILMDELLRARLLIIDKDDQGEPVVTIAHETMLHEWQSLSSWIEHRESMLRHLRHLKEGAEAYLAGGRRPDDLTLRDARLATAEEFVSRPGGLHVPPEVREFVEAHVRVREAEARRERARIARIMAILSLAFIVSACLAGFAFHKERESRRERMSAEESRKVAGEFGKQSSGLANFLLDQMKDKLDPNNEKDRDIIDKIATKLTEHFADGPVPGKTPEERLAFANDCAAAAVALGALDRWKDAIRIMNRSVTLIREHQWDGAPELVMHFGYLGTWRGHLGDPTGAIEEYRNAIRTNNAQSAPNLVEGIRLRNEIATQHRLLGKYSAIIVDSRALVRELEEIAAKEGPQSKAAWNALPDAYEAHAEALRYAGRIPEAWAVYEAMMRSLEVKQLAIPHRQRVEIGVVLGELGRYDEAISHFDRAIEDAVLEELGAVRRAQYEYKYARVLIGKGDLDAAERLISKSYAELVRDQNPGRLAKCLEARARLRLRQGRVEEALQDAREVLRIRTPAEETVWDRNYLDALVLLTDCREALGREDEAKRARFEEDKVREEITLRERNAALDLGEPPPNFERHGR